MGPGPDDAGKQESFSWIGVAGSCWLSPEIGVGWLSEALLRFISSRTTYVHGSVLKGGSFQSRAHSLPFHASTVALRVPGSDWLCVIPGNALQEQ